MSTQAARGDGDTGNDIAIVGMSGRFPGARDLGEFWSNLRGGVESIRFFTDEELLAAGVHPDLLARPGYVRASPTVADIDRFDAGFFGYNGREAALLDPQQRLFLECAWEALESAGHPPDGFDGVVGVYAGSYAPMYLMANLLGNRQVIASAQAFEALISNDKDFLATRVAYKLDLRGPAVTVQTACSTSLVAVHLAAQSLLDDECDLALAGGVCLRVPMDAGYLYQDGVIFSPDGHCRPFSAEATGTVFGSGVGVVALRRLGDALASGDPVLAVIKASAVNNDGASKAGYTTPSVEGQTEVIATALGLSGVEPHTIGVVEGHGTGTPLGDPLEVVSLTRAFAGRTDKRGFCALGSVKSNIGHLDTAAGVAGLIKAVLQLRHREIVPSLHLGTTNPEIDFPATPFYPSTELAEWRRNGTPRRAGVSSFGIGGTNAHVILEEAPDRPAADPPARPWQLLPVSARSAEALEAAADRLADHLRSAPDGGLADAAYTLQVGRSRFRHRRVVVGDSAAAAVDALLARDPVRVAGGVWDGTDRAPVLLFPGQGAQHVGMTRQLAAADPAYRAHLEECLDQLRPHLEEDLRAVLFADPDDAAATARLTRTELAQPALFAVEYAVARLLLDWGFRPRALLGHSIGELVGACLAGVFSLADGAALVAARGRLMGARPTGAMLSVGLGAAEVTGLLGPDLDLAADNAPGLSVVAGPAGAIDDLAAGLGRRGVSCRRLHTSHAFHSVEMDPVVVAVTEQVRRIPLSPPRIPVVSNVTGDWLSPEQATDPAYWGQQLRRTVRFSAGVATALAAGPAVLVEVGPGRTLSTLVRQAPDARAGSVAVTTLPAAGSADDDAAAVLAAVGRCWVAGYEPDWAALHAGTRRSRAVLPTYPFQRQRYWVEPRDPAGAPVDLGLDDAVGTGDLAAVEAHPRPALLADYVAPRDDREAALAGIWQELLGVDRVGVRDDFFELGGHSLLASQVMARIIDRFGVRVTLRDLMEVPTVEGLAALVGRAGQAPGDGAAEEPLPAVVADPGARFEPFPLSEIQQAQYIGRLGGFDFGGVAAHVYFEIDSHLDLDRLADAWEQVVERHDMLRAVIRPDGFQQVVAGTPPYRIAVEDLSGLPAADRAAALAAVRDAMSHEVRPADRYPLFEVRASRLPAGRSRLHLSFDLLIADIGSLRLVLSEWRRRYQDPDLRLDPLRASYRDYVLAEAAVRDTPRYARALEFWRDRISVLPPAPELPMVPAGRAGGSVFTARSRHLAAADWTRLKERAARHGLTASTVVAAAYASVLGGWSAAPRFLLNLTIINRLPLHEQVPELVGEFASFDLLPVDVGDTPAFLDLARALQRQSWADLEHRWVNGVRVLRELARVRGNAAGAVAPVVLTSTLVQAVDTDQETMFDWMGEVVHDISQTPQVWLDHAVIEERAGLTLSWHAIEALFPAGLLDAMFDGYGALLTALAISDEAWADPDRDWLPAGQRAVRDAVNDTAADLPARLLHEEFFARAAERPDATAVVAPDRVVPYGELAGRAAQVGSLLRAAGVRPGDRVAVSVPKGWQQIAAAIGVLAAGGAYVPVAPDLPDERRQYLARHAAVGAVVGAAGGPAWRAGVPVVEVPGAADEGWRTAERPAADRDPGDLAYVIYTSGSTGEPKGVAVAHRAAWNTLADVNRRFGIGPDDRVLALSSLSFDLSVWDLFGVLGAGGAVVLPPPGAGRDPASWLELVREHGVTLWNTVPALMDMCAEYAAATDPVPLPLRLVLLSGDWIPVGLPDRVRALAPAARVVSLGGATEGAVWSIAYEVGEVDPGWESIPYGTPLANQTFHVLDERMRPRPEWVPGDLYIGGAGLADGYWRDPERTAEAFRVHPATGERLYRTGDLGRYQPDGVIEFLGRRDAQVKVGGYRIELGEVEAALQRHPGVERAVAAAVGTDRHHRRLVGYVVPADGGDLGDLAGQVRAFVAERLPAYLVPGTVVVIGEVPLSANGKVDRSALPVPGADGGSAAEDAPQEWDDVARTVAAVVADVLGVAEVGLHDNFFTLGGDSIQGVQAVSRLAGEGYEVGPQDLFEHQTVAGLAAVLRGTGGGGELPVAAVPLTAYQRGLLERPAGGAAQWLTVELAAAVPVDRLAAAAGRLVARHEVLRRVPDPAGLRWVQPGGEPPPVSVDLLELGELDPADRADAVLRLARDAAAELDPAAGRLLHLTLLDVGDAPPQLLLVCAEAVADDRSCALLAADLLAAAEPGAGAPAAGRPDFARRWAEQTVKAERAEQAEQAVPGGPGVGAPAGDPPELVRAVYRELPATVTADLLGGSAEAYRVTRLETVLAGVRLALDPLVPRGTGVAVELERAGRDDAGAGTVPPDAVGCFVLGGTAVLAPAGDPAAALVAAKDAVRGGPGSDAAELLVRDSGELTPALPGGHRVLGELPAPARWTRHGPRLALTTALVDGRLGLRWTFDPRRHDPQEVEALADRLVAGLDAVREHCADRSVGVVAPSDFPYSGLSQSELDAFLTVFSDPAGTGPAELGAEDGRA